MDHKTFLNILSFLDAQGLEHLCTYSKSFQELCHSYRKEICYELLKRHYEHISHDNACIIYRIFRKYSPTLQITTHHILDMIVYSLVSNTWDEWDALSKFLSDNALMPPIPQIIEALKAEILSRNTLDLGKDWNISINNVVHDLKPYIFEDMDIIKHEIDTGNICNVNKILKYAKATNLFERRRADLTQAFFDVDRYTSNADKEKFQEIFFHWIRDIPALDKTLIYE
jgi:hypothetical protein